MKLNELKNILEKNADSELALILPGGSPIPSHAHVTEVGRVEKTFLDCGGKLRKTAVCSLQVWVANDLEHRLAAGKLAAIFDEASGFLGEDDPEMQIEFQENSISLFSVDEVTARDGALVFKLAAKQTACLAMDVCLPETEGCCGSADSTCCR